MRTEELYIRAEQNGISILLDVPLPLTKSLSADIDGQLYVGIDQKVMESKADERVHLAHELGHCETGAFYSLYSPIDNRKWCENKADRRAISMLIPSDELLSIIQASDGQIPLWELAEHFCVTEEFMQKAVEHYFNS